MRKETEMRNRGMLVIGAALILFGFLLLIGAIFDVDVGILCFPTFLILLGIWILVRPQLVRPGTGMAARILGDVRRSGSWDVSEEEFWVGIGDVRLDLTEANVPEGKTSLRIYGFVGDVRIVIPEGLGVAVASSAFLCDARVLGRKTDTFLGTFYWESEGYQEAERQVQFETLHFVHSLRITQPQAEPGPQE
jgi:predicted membrane protein